jgi:glycosyltransferase involved in cell wall biosynthesis
MFTDSYWPRVNGVVVSVESFSRALMRAGHQVTIITSLYPESQPPDFVYDRDQPERDIDHEPVVIRVPSHPLSISAEDRIAKFHKLGWVSKQLDAYKPDVVHIHSEFVMGEFGYYYARLNHLPVIYTFHTLWEEYAAHYIPFIPPWILRFFSRRIVRNMANRADAIIAPSIQIIEALKRYKVKKAAILLPTGIDQQIFITKPETVVAFRNSLELMYPRLKGRRILLFAGRVGAEKNIHFLVRMLPLVIAKHKETVLMVVGGGPDLQHLQDEAARIGIADHCVCTGYLDRRNLALVYAMADIFVFPSLTETQGLVTIEAMTSGTPVVAIGAMGTITVMNGDNGGFMVQDDLDAFATRVIDLLDDPALYAQKCAQAQEHAKAWTIDIMATRLERIYKDACAASLHDFQ